MSAEIKAYVCMGFVGELSSCTSRVGGAYQLKTFKNNLIIKSGSIESISCVKKISEMKT